MRLGSWIMDKGVLFSLGGGRCIHMDDIDGIPGELVVEAKWGKVCSFYSFMDTFIFI